MLLGIMASAVSLGFLGELLQFYKIKKTLSVSKQYIYYYLLSKNLQGISLDSYYNTLGKKLIGIYSTAFFFSVLFSKSSLKYSWCFQLLILLGVVFVRVFNRKIIEDQLSILSSIALKDRSSQN